MAHDKQIRILKDSRSRNIRVEPDASGRLQFQCSVLVACLMGFLTPVLSILACVAPVANLFLAEQPIHILGILTSAALFLLGPGAYSVDARLFGLRVTVVPPRKN